MVTFWIGEPTSANHPPRTPVGRLRKLGEGAFAGPTGFLVALDESKEPRKMLAVGLTREPGRAKPKA